MNRIFGKERKTGGKIEIFFSEKTNIEKQL